MLYLIPGHSYLLDTIKFESLEFGLARLLTFFTQEYALDIF